MIEIQYKKILFLQAIFLFVLGITLFYFFKTFFRLSVPSTFWSTYLIVWSVFIVANLLFIKFFALPTKGLLKKLESGASNEELSWSAIEDTLSKRDVHHMLIQSEYEIENLKYKILLDSLHDPVCIFGKNQVILYSNLAFNKLFSINGPSVQSSLLEVTRNHDFHRFVATTIDSNEAQKLSEFSFNPIQDAFKAFYEIKVFPLKEVQNYLCIMHDMTERKLADQMREDFVANFSHEVRTPLTILNGQAQTLRMMLEKQDNFEAQFSPIFEKIDNNSRRLVNLFTDLLRLTSVEKKKNIVKESIEIAPLIEGLVEELATGHPKKKVAFTYDFKVTHLLVDYNLFEQVMINLIDNAYKYTRDPGEVHISTKKLGEKNILEISDNGVGIPIDQHHRIFERFFRVDSSRSNEITGTGLGLSIVKHIMQKHEGKIKVSANAGQGTTFTLIFPA